MGNGTGLYSSITEKCRRRQLSEYSTKRSAIRSATSSSDMVISFRQPSLRNPNISLIAHAIPGLIDDIDAVAPVLAIEVGDVSGDVDHFTGTAEHFE